MGGIVGKERQKAHYCIVVMSLETVNRNLLIVGSGVIVTSSVVA